MADLSFLGAAASDPRIQALLAGMAHGANGGDPMPMPSDPRAMGVTPPVAPGSTDTMRPMPVPDAIPSGPVSTQPSDPPGSLLFSGGNVPWRAPMSADAPGAAPYDGGMSNAIRSMFGVDVDPKATGSAQADSPDGLRAQAQALRAQSGAIGPAPVGRPAFRLPDLLAALPALLMGRQAPQYLASFLGGKVGYAQDQQAYQDRANDLQRANLGAQATGLQTQAATQDENATKRAVADTSAGARMYASDDTLTGRKYGADQGLTGRKYVADGRLQETLDTNRTRLKVADLNDDTKRDIALRISQDNEGKSLLANLMKLPPAARPGFAAQLATLPQFADLDPDAIVAVGQQTLDEQKKASDIAVNATRREDLHNHAGYLGAMEDQIERLTPAKVDLLKSEAKAQRSASLERMSMVGVNTQRAVQIQKENSHYEIAFRNKQDEIKARIAKMQQPAGNAAKPPSVATMTQVYKQQAFVAASQIKRILAATGGQEPEQGDPGSPERARFVAYQQAVADEGDAQKQIFALGRRGTAMSPENTGTPSAGAPPSDPTKGPTLDMADYGTKVHGSNPTVFGFTPYDADERLYLQQAQRALDAHKDPNIIKAAVVAAIAQHRKAKGYVK